MTIKRRTEIECILCKSIIKFPEYVGEDFTVGDLLCAKCESLLRIKLKKWKVQEFTVRENGWEKWKERKQSEPSDKLLALQEKARRSVQIEKNAKAGG